MRKWILFFVFTPAILFPLAALFVGLRNPSIFPFFSNFPLFSIILLILVSVAVIVLLGRQNSLQENMHGLILFLSFTTGYFLLAGLFNKVETNTNNVYFAADSWSWLWRMALEEGWNVGTRAVHPYAHLIFRPLITTLSIVLGGDRLEANLLVLALAGGACVFLMWKIVRQITGDEMNAILFASLLGLSASHLIFATVIETYIFSALFLLLFIWLLLKDKVSWLLIATSVITFGITITNILQQALTMLLVQRNLKRTALTFTLAILLGIGLNIFSRIPYPSTQYVFLLENLAGEQRFQKQPTLDRFVLMTENVLVYNIAAPPPYISIRNGIPRFNLVHESISRYAWFGWPTVALWLAMILGSLLYFLKNIRLPELHSRLALSMLTCLAFNFLLHIGYGGELFLYSPDWTYALILFVVISLNRFAEQNWFKALLFLLVSSVFVNNLWFIYIVTRRISGHLE